MTDRPLLPRSVVRGPRSRPSDRRPVTRTAAVLWVTAITVFSVFSLLAVTAVVGMFAETDRPTTALVEQVRIGSQPRSLDTCVYDLAYAIGGSEHRASAGVAWFECPADVAAGDTVQIRYTASDPERVIVAGSEGHVVVRDLGMVVALALLPTAYVWVAGMSALRRRRRQLAASIAGTAQGTR